MSNILSINGYKISRIDDRPMVSDLQLAEKLGYKQPRDIRKLIKRLCQSGFIGPELICATVAQNTGRGRPSTVYLLSEKACLKVITKSETEIADKITDEIIDVFMEVRKGVDAPPVGSLEWIEIMRQKEEQRLLLEQEKQQLECQILEFKPKVEFCDKVTNSEDAISVSQAAKVIGTGQKRLFAYMRQHKWVNRRNEPYQFMINSGYLDVKLGQFNHPSQGLVDTVTALVTGKGLIKLEEEYRRDHPV